MCPLIIIVNGFQILLFITEEHLKLPVPTSHPIPVKSECPWMRAGSPYLRSLELIAKSEGTVPKTRLTSTRAASLGDPKTTLTFVKHWEDSQNSLNYCVITVYYKENITDQKWAKGRRARAASKHRSTKHRAFVALGTESGCNPAPASVWQCTRNIADQGSAPELHCPEFLLGLHPVVNLGLLVSWYCVTFPMPHCWVFLERQPPRWDRLCGCSQPPLESRWYAIQYDPRSPGKQRYFWQP